MEVFSGFGVEIKILGCGRDNKGMKGDRCWYWQKMESPIIILIQEIFLNVFNRIFSIFRHKTALSTL